MNYRTLISKHTMKTANKFSAIILQRFLSILPLCIPPCPAMGINGVQNIQVLNSNGYPPEFVDLTTSFTIANTDIGSVWTSIPYRERYLRRREEGPCKTFSLKLPDEKPNMTSIDLCIFRSKLESALETPQSLFTPTVSNHSRIDNEWQLNVEGYVLNNPRSRVYGYLVHSCFYGKIHMVDPKTNAPTVIVVEQASILPELMNNDMKLLKSLLYVMKNQPKDGFTQSEYNAVVSKDRSLASFLRSKRFSSPSGLNTFIAFSSDENTFIMPGEPSLNIDSEGRLRLNVEKNSITVENDGSVLVKAHDVQYKIRPSGLAVATTGAEIETLQEHAGSVAVMAVSNNISFNCLLPPPSFNPSRKGGFLCKVCVLRDASFRKHYPELEEENILFNVIDWSSWVFRSVDWDLDGNPDNIGLLYSEKQELKWSKKMRYIDGAVSKEELELLFAELSQRDFSDCCLAIAYTMFAFPESLFSMSSPKTSSPFGFGICAVKTSSAISNNVILISANVANDSIRIYSPMRLDQLTYLTTHEIAKSFGASPETTEKGNCVHFKDRYGFERHHIMWPGMMRNITEEEKTFSYCTKKTLLESLSSCKTACFQIDPYPFCGNGIVEDGEECDCGHSFNCSQQLCCYARSGRHPCMKTGMACLSAGSQISYLNLYFFWSFAMVLTLSILTKS